MKIQELSDAQVLRYFESRLKQLRRSGSSHMAKCLWHDDRHASLSVNIEKKVWRCHGPCAIGGGMIDFEKKFSSCDDQTAMIRIGEVVGVAQLNMGQQPETIYPYTDAFGKLLFQVVRYPGKRFVQRQPDSKGGWIYKTSDLKMVLYNLPKVVTARHILVVEGEKDCDNLTAALGSEDIAVTTSPRGAGKWKDEFSVFFAGKQVAIFPDNDSAGTLHGAVIAASVYRYSQQVKIIALPDLPEKGDVSDFLKNHNGADVVNAIKNAKWWKPDTGNDATSLFLSSAQFQENAPNYIDWILEGVIQRGSNGLFIARPKSGKSYAVVDLAIALASGQKWLGFFVPQRVRVALVSREDTAGLTQSRMKKLMAHRNLTSADLEGFFYINAKGSRPKIMLDYEDDVVKVISDLKQQKSEFLILDVMRVLHSADENDNTEMQRVLSVLNRIQDEAGCSICLVHHDNKRDDATLTERARGASAIAGYAEFICGIRVVEEETWTREFVCELKAAMPPDRFYWRILDTPDNAISLEQVEYTPQSKSGKSKKSEPAPWGGTDD